METQKFGNLLRELRLEKKFTQIKLAEKLHLSDKTVSKWERGLGLPDVSMLPLLSDIFEVNIEEMLGGSLSKNDIVNGNMQNAKYFVCESCGNLIFSTGNATVFCCGKKLRAFELQKATETQKMQVEEIEDEWHVTSNHPMNKDNYISFVALTLPDKVFIVKQFPEWDLNAVFPKREHGRLIWFSENEGLLYQNI